MPDTTLAALLVAPRQIELRDFPLPPIDEDSGLARIEITGVCGADWPIYTGDLAKFAPPPLIPGHEIVARVERIGKRAAARWGVHEGDRIVMEEYAPCGHCEYCLSGRYYICSGMKMEKMYGFTGLDVAPGLWGGYSEFVYLDPQAIVHKLADSVPTEIAPFFVPLANGIRWTHLEGGVGIGSTVVIQGPGGQGLACTIAAKEAGAAQIIVTGRARDAARLALAREFGAHHTVDVDEVGDVVAHVRELTGGRMADTV
ncbi:MAG: alcohol dehydrogenase catalytic domain-containing protein, partial [Candidatus Lustribacter sp.]